MAFFHPFADGGGGGERVLWWVLLPQRRRLQPTSRSALELLPPHQQSSRPCFRMCLACTACRAAVQALQDMRPDLKVCCHCCCSCSCLSFWSALRSARHTAPLPLSSACTADPLAAVSCCICFFYCPYTTPALQHHLSLLQIAIYCGEGCTPKQLCEHVATRFNLQIMPTFQVGQRLALF